MKLEIEIPDEKVEQFAKDLMENYPEASAGNSLKCIQTLYNLGRFKFIDDETGKEHIILTSDVAKTIPKFIEGILKNKWKFDGITANNVLSLDAGDYDGYSIDAIVQLALCLQVSLPRSRCPQHPILGRLQMALVDRCYSALECRCLRYSEM